MALVYNTLRTPGGAPIEQHTVVVELLASGNPFTLDNSEVVWRDHPITDTTGRWQIELAPQTDYEEPGTRYVVDEGKHGHTWVFTVPAEGTYWLRDLIDTQWPGPYPEQTPVEPHKLGSHSDVDVGGAVTDDVLAYDAATATWVPKYATPASTGNTLVERDGMGRAQFGAPEVDSDAATKAYADTKIPLTQRGAANGVATLDANALIPNGQLPPLAITDTHVVASETEMLALAAQEGDVAVRTDESISYILTAEPASTLGNWQQLLTPPDAVTSVNGETGVVSLNAADVGAIDTAARGAAGGVASLDTSTRLPLAQMPADISTVDPLPALDGQVTDIDGRVTTLEDRPYQQPRSAADDTQLYGDTISNVFRTSAWSREPLGNGYLSAAATRSNKTFTATGFRLCVVTEGASTLASFYMDLKVYTGPDPATLTAQATFLSTPELYRSGTGVMQVALPDIPIAEGETVAFAMNIQNAETLPIYAATAYNDTSHLLLADGGNVYGVWEQGRALTPPDTIDLTGTNWNRADYQFWFALV